MRETLLFTTVQRVICIITTEPVTAEVDETLLYMHRRRIELEDKAKVVALDWGTESLPR